MEPLYTIPNPTNVSFTTASVLLSKEEMPLAALELGASYLNVELSTSGSQDSSSRVLQPPISV